MTTPDSPSDSTTSSEPDQPTDDEVLAPATPGAQALPTGDDADHEGD